MKAVLPRKAKQGILSLLSKGQQVFSLPQEISDVLCALDGTVVRKTNTVTLDIPTFLFLSHSFYCSAWCMEYSFGQLRSAVLAVSPQLLVHSQPARCGVE